MMIETTSKIAGVTFNNDPEYGGRSRQEILKEFIDKGLKVIDLKLVHTTFTRPDGTIEPAIMAFEKQTCQMIGWIPKKDIEKLKGVTRMIGIISHYKDTYSVGLTVPKDPTPKQYAYCKELCKKMGYQMPVYDSRVYHAFITTVKGMKNAKAKEALKS